MTSKDLQGDPATGTAETAGQEPNTTGQESTVSGTQQVTGSSSTEGQATTPPEPDISDSTNTSTEEPSFNKEALLSDLHKERNQRKSLQAQVETLTSESAASQQSLSDLSEVQGKYDRLESFLTSVGGPLSKALDSKSFSEKLFGTDTDITELVAEWHKSNPSATSTALGSGSASPATKQAQINDLIRAAAK